VLNALDVIRYDPSLSRVIQTLLRGTVKLALRCNLPGSVSSCSAFRCTCSARRYIRKGALLSQVLVNTTAHTSVGGSSSRMSEPVFFHTVDNRTPSTYRFILRDKAASVQLCVTVCLLQGLKHLYSCVSLCAYCRAYRICTVLCHCVLTAGPTDFTAYCLMYYWRCY
jgi:hypothetical protein